MLVIKIIILIMIVMMIVCMLKYFNRENDGVPSKEDNILEDYAFR